MDMQRRLLHDGVRLLLVPVSAERRCGFFLQAHRNYDNCIDSRYPEPYR